MPLPALGLIASPQIIATGGSLVAVATRYGPQIAANLQYYAVNAESAAGAFRSLGQAWEYVQHGTKAAYDAFQDLTGTSREISQTATQEQHAHLQAPLPPRL